MRVAIIGTRGVPNFYGGFEQFAEYLSSSLIEKGHQVTVYNSHDHPYQQDNWKGVQIIHCFDPEDKIGTIGQFIYDFNCILDARRRKFDVILQLGYTSSSVWGWLLPRKKCVVTTNMDGLEWKRTKYTKPVQSFLKWAEKLAVRYSDHLIADSIGIQKYLKTKYQKEAIYIPYGATVFEKPDDSCLADYGLHKFQYNMLVARLEPENNIETILDGVVAANTNIPFLVIGKHETVFGEYLKNKYSHMASIRFLGGMYDMYLLNNLRHYSNIYFHGHTVGGTNPSLLEAMASQCFICAHNNIFNRSILGEDAFYFKNATEIAEVLKKEFKIDYFHLVRKNEEKIRLYYSWPKIVEQYLIHFKKILGSVAIDETITGPSKTSLIE